MRREPPLPKELWDQIPPAAHAALWVLIESYERCIAALEAERAELKAQLHQNSRNSSRSPSSDGPEVKRTPPRAPAGRKRGAQPGHGRYERTLVPLEQVGEVIPCKPRQCRRWGESLQGDDPQPLRHQVLELPPFRECLKTPRSPFDKLRANGSEIEIVTDFPFMLSLSKHENHFLSSLRYG
jgi:transposase